MMITVSIEARRCGKICTENGSSAVRSEGGHPATIPVSIQGHRESDLSVRFLGDETD